MTAPIPLEEAWKRLFALAEPLDSELVSIDAAAGRWLVADLRARRTQPYADLSAMDGFAVSGSGPWTLTGESRAGHSHDVVLSAGQAVRISTGAACPIGTEGIVIVEQGRVDEGVLTAPAPKAGRHIRRRGFDFSEGDALLARGTQLAAAQIALARAGGHGLASVARRPRVAIIECGDELVGDPASCPRDKLPSSNGAMVAALAQSVGADTRIIGPLPDERTHIGDAIADSRNADVIITTAGASVGAHDHVRSAFADCGADLGFWRVAIRPGKPLMVGRLGPSIVMGLPGNPASAYVTSFLFVLPLLRALQGAAKAEPSAVALPLSAALPAGGDRREFLRATYANGEARPLPEQDSSALLTLARASLLIDRPVGAHEAPRGAMVSCFWLQTIGFS